MWNSRVSPAGDANNSLYQTTKMMKYNGLRRRKGSTGSGRFVHTTEKKKTNISRNFAHKECFRYVEHKNNQCACGLQLTKHPADVLYVKKPDYKWLSAKCTRKIPADTYGEIEFMDSRGSRKPYIRVSDDTDGLMLLKLMRQKWDLDIPNLVISVTGGAKSFHLKPRLKEAFTKGLVKVAVSTEAWIITGGTNAGVMKHVGEAIKNRGVVANIGRSKINVIGIAPWGVIDNNHLLVSKDGGGLYPSDYNYDTFDQTKTCLDFNHSHFILVDNGTTGKYGTEIELRSRVEGSIAKFLKTNSNAATGTIGIPVVILCLEGGPNTIKTLAEGVKKGTPAVVIDGSGRASDVVCYAYKHLIYDEQSERSVIDPEYVDAIKQKVCEVFGEQSKDTVYAEIEQLLKDEQMITVFRLDDESGHSDMDLAILRALLKANKASFQMQLKLALAWNRIDVARSEIFTEDLKQDNFKVEWLYESFFTALSDNKPDFVELFLNEGVNLKHFLTLEVLIQLYSSAPNGSGLRELLNTYQSRSSDGQSVTMQEVGQVIESLMSDQYKSRYQSDFSYRRKCEQAGDQRISEHRKSVTKNLFTDSEDEVGLPSPYLDLFTWAVLLNRRELAYLVWRRTRDSIAAALMASKLLKSLAENIRDNKEHADMFGDLNEHADFYEGVAVGVLDECRNDDENTAQTLLVKELPEFGYLTSLDIAVSANNQDFIAHTSCQMLLSRLWMGALYINTSIWKMLPCIFLPFLVPSVISFHDDTVVDRDPVDYIHHASNPNLQSEEKLNLNDSMDLNRSDYSMGKASLHGNDFEMDEKKEPEEDQDSHTVLDHFDDEPDDIIIRKKPSGFFHRIVYFYEAPFVKFYVNVLSYTGFLLLYAFIILTHFNVKVHVEEFFLQFWVFTLFCEEIRQLATQEPITLAGKVTAYCSDPWNIADMFALSGFFIGTLFRYIASELNSSDYLVVARIIYATDIVIFIVRLLQIFSVNRHMGPKLVMIRKMLDDLVYFVVILAVFVIGYGVAKQAVLHPNAPLWDACVGVVNHPYWQMYGELFVDDIFETKVNCTTGQPLCEQEGADSPCLDEYGLYVLPIYMGVYMLFTNILLLNLLIAIFNYTFEKIQEASDKVWKFQRFDLISEYHDRPALFPPFIIISHIIFLARWLFGKCGFRSSKDGKGSTMRVTLLAEEAEQLALWEFGAAEAFCYRSTVKDAETQDERVKIILNKVNQLSEEMELHKEGESTTKESTGGAIRPDTRRMSVRRQTTNQTNVEVRLAKLENSLSQVVELLIQQNQKHASLMEASREMMSGKAVTIQDPKKSRITSIHTKARSSPYPGSMIQRFRVNDDQVSWQEPLENYCPVSFTAPVVLKMPYWADVDLMQMTPRPKLKFNVYDDVNKVNRKSHICDYDVVDELPRNPYGRTGIIGRGSLGRFGPNHAADPIATRWKRDSTGVVIDGGKRVLEFIAIQRRDNHQWAIPGGMVEPGEHVSETLRKEFTEEALNQLEMSEDRKRQVADRIAYLFRNGVEVYKGYVDDPRNTDNAWMETVACNFHDDTGEVFGEFHLQAGDDAQAVRWQRVSGNIPLFASHVGILEKVSQMHNAAFY